MIRLLLLLTAGLTLLAAGCRQSTRSEATAADVVIALVDDADSRPLVGPGSLTIRLTTADGAPISDATVEVRGDMAHAGMVPSLAEVAPGQAPGEYVAALEWTMAGDWVVTVTATLSDGRAATQEFPLRVEGE